ncbi:MAG: hypothetical protein AAB896_01370 [Patescibacteria group bacterium]
MTNKSAGLYELFRPAKYSLSISEGACRLVIEGQKIGPPSKRITLHQKSLKITSAIIIRQDKKGSIGQEVLRINHLPSFEQVRLHTTGTLYPGPYIIELNYRLDPEKLHTLKNLADEKPHRDLLPCIDEPEAWDSAKVVISE